MALPPRRRRRARQREEIGTRGKHREPSERVKEGARGKSDISHVLLATWRAMKGVDEIELQIHCLRTKVDNLKVQGPN
jgi:hypothetical protein